MLAVRSWSSLKQCQLAAWDGSLAWDDSCCIVGAIQRYYGDWIHCYMWVYVCWKQPAPRVCLLIVMESVEALFLEVGSRKRWVDISTDCTCANTIVPYCLINLFTISVHVTLIVNTCSVYNVLHPWSYLLEATRRCLAMLLYLFAIQ